MRLGAVGWELLGLNIGHGGYMWSKHPNTRLTGRIGSHVYTSVSDAMSACIARGSCKGVTEEGNSRFGIYTGNTPSRASGKTSYVKGEVQTIASGVYWSEISDATLTGYVDKVNYKSLAAAQKACSEKVNCRGITLTGGVYRLNTVDYIEYSSTSTVYLRGGDVADEVSFEVSYKDHVWTVESPYQIEGGLCDGRRYRNYDQALKVRL